MSEKPRSITPVSREPRHQGNGVPAPVAAGTSSGQRPKRASGHELAERPFEMDGESWLARLDGSSLAGTGALGLARLCMVRFYRQTSGEIPVRELLIAPCSLYDLKPSELEDLFLRAQVMPTPDR